MMEASCLIFQTIDFLSDLAMHTKIIMVLCVDTSMSSHVIDARCCRELLWMLGTGLDADATTFTIESPALVPATVR